MDATDKWSPEIILIVAVAILVARFGDAAISNSLKLLVCLLALGLLVLIGTKSHCALYGGLSLLGVMLLPCAAFLDLAFVWCAASFTFRDFIQDERIMLKHMRDLHPAGGGASKRGKFWKY